MLGPDNFGAIAKLFVYRQQAPEAFEYPSPFPIWVRVIFKLRARFSCEHVSLGEGGLAILSLYEDGVFPSAAFLVLTKL